MTPSSIIVTTSAPPRTGQPNFLSWLGRCVPRVDCVLFVKGLTIKE